MIAPSPFTTENILTSRSAMNLTTATPLQRALCRALDGFPLGDLADRDDVRAAFGGAEAVAALPVGEPPFEFHALASIRSAKTMIAVARCIAITQSVDVSGCSPGDIVRGTVSALKLEGTKPFMSHLVAALETQALRGLVIGEPTVNGVTLRHPSGRAVEITPIPIDRAGGSGLSVWDMFDINDEAPRMLGEDDGSVKNFDEKRRAILGRILPNGQLLTIGSPHAPWGPVFSAYQDHFGKPSTHVVVFQGDGRAMNPKWWTEDRCKKLQARDEGAYQSDCLAQFRTHGSSTAFPFESVEAAFTAKMPNEDLGE